jgi:hypothetical protein
MIVQIGPHTVEVEGDCLIVSQRGTFMLEHMQLFLAEADKVIAEHGRMFIINHSTGGGNYAPEARRLASKWANAVHCQGAAIYGASFAFSVIISMMARAIAIFSSHNIPLVSVPTEPEARAWVAAKRQKWLASRQIKK